WQDAEQDAWDDYANAVGNPDPAHRITEPTPEVPNLDPAPVLPTEPRDPGLLVAMGRAPAVRVTQLLAAQLTPLGGPILLARVYLASNDFKAQVRTQVLAEMAGNPRAANTFNAANPGQLLGNAGLTITNEHN